MSNASLRKKKRHQGTGQPDQSQLASAADYNLSVAPHDTVSTLMIDFDNYIFLLSFFFMTLHFPLYAMAFS